MNLDPQFLHWLQTSTPAARARTWQLRTTSLVFGEVPSLMGIVNVTPDSFSDGGKFASHELAIAHGLQLLAEGAEILDIGGESTRPYAQPVTEQEELSRVVPVIAALHAAQPQAILSIDTSKAAVAEAALAAGAQIINDVTGLAGDPRMVSVAREFGAGVCAMHMQGTPQTMQNQPHYGNVVAEIYDYLQARRDSLIAQGIQPARICLDPGIGFGKTHSHNITLLQSCWKFHQLGCPLLVGHSRKGFIGKLAGSSLTERDAGTLGGTLALALQQVQIVRVHEVASQRAALAVFGASQTSLAVDATASKTPT